MLVSQAYEKSHEIKKISVHYFTLRALIQSHGLQVLRLFGILCGSDYYKIAGFGPVKALDVIQQVYTQCTGHTILPCFSDDSMFMQTLVRVICEVAPQVDRDAMHTGLLKALLAFEHHRVFNPLTQQFEYARSSPAMVVRADILGALPEAEEDMKIALDSVLCRGEIPSGGALPGPVESSASW